MRESMVFYRSFFEAVEDLPPEEFKQSVLALLKYGLDGTSEDVGGIAKAILTLAKPQIDKNNKRYECSRMGGRKPSGNQTEENETELKPNRNRTVTEYKPNANRIETEPQPNVNVNVNDNVLKENTLKGVKEKHFVPPTPENVSGYCREMGYTYVDAERFVDFYGSKNWMVGKTKMTDWRAAVRNWERQEKKQRQGVTANVTKAAAKNSFNNFEQREYDYDAMLYGDTMLRREEKT